LKGGGGGNFAVVTRVTLRVHPLPETFGAVNLTVKASSDAAFLKLIALALDFCAAALVDLHWGEQLRFRRDNALQVAMVFQGLSRSEAVAAWQPFFDSLDASPKDFDPVLAASHRLDRRANLLSADAVQAGLGFIKRDDRPGAAEANVFWPGDQGQAGQMLHGYESLWLGGALLRDARRAALVDALFAATRHWSVSLHLNKGLAGAPAQAIADARDTATNPAVLDAFALAILGAHGDPAYPGVRGHEPDEALAQRRRRRSTLPRPSCRSLPRAAPISRRATISSATISAPSGEATRRACKRSRRRWTRMACSSPITGRAASSGAATGSRALRRARRRRSPASGHACTSEAKAVHTRSLQHCAP
jgi:hypothetical protein